MEDGFAAFERLTTTAELRSVFVVESLGQDDHLSQQVQQQVHFLTLTAAQFLQCPMLSVCIMALFRPPGL